MSTPSRHPRIVFAGDRDISVEVLDFLEATDAEIVVLLLPDDERASHARALRDRCDHLDDSRVLRGDSFRDDSGLRLLRDLDIDYILSIHFPHLVPQVVLDIPKHDALNLHPAYLPYNRGWHTPTWAIWEGTTYGATIHRMVEDVDAGDIVARKQVPVRVDDTADSLYGRVKRAEVKLFEETWPSLAAFEYETQSQSDTEATVHKRSDIADIQQLELNQTAETAELLRRLRALTTNDVTEAAFFEHEGERYYVQVDIIPEDDVE